MKALSVNKGAQGYQYFSPNVDVESANVEVGANNAIQSAASSPSNSLVDSPEATLTKYVFLKGIGHSFGSVTYLFQNITLTLKPGKSYALVGPSGSGKSTLLNILSDMLSPTFGDVEFNNIDSVRWVFQNPHGVPKRTAIDHVTLPLLAKGMDRADSEVIAKEFLHKFNLQDLAKRPFSELSGGEAQRLMLARALASKPDLLLVDEPTAMLDISTAKTVSTTLGGIAKSGAIVVIATHDEEVMRRCDFVIDLKDYVHAP